MPEFKQGHVDPTEEEEAEIQRQIAEDPDDSAHWKDNTSARPAIAVDPVLVEWSLKSRTPLHNSSDDFEIGHSERSRLNVKPLTPLDTGPVSEYGASSSPV